MDAIWGEFDKKSPNIVLCSEPFHKAEFLDRLISSAEYPIIFIDMDLLYTGYAESGMVQESPNLTKFYLTEENWRGAFAEIVSKASRERSLVVIDSFNGIYNAFGDLEAAIFINSCIMLLSSLGRDAGSSVIITAMARKAEDGGWILVPGGKQIIRSAKTGVYHLKRADGDLVIRQIGVNT